MDRNIVYPGAIPLDTDALTPQVDAMVALGWLLQSVMGTNTGVVGLPCAPTSPASMVVNVGPGAIWSLEEIDTTAFGSLAADTSNLMKMGINKEAAGTNFTLTAPTASGDSINYLIEAAFSETDGTPVVLPYYNSANPSQPYSGPSNSGTAQNTIRAQTVELRLKAGAAAPSGTQITPAADTGYVGLYVITVNYGQTAITSSDIATALGAPFIGGPFAALGGSSSQPFAVGGYGLFLTSHDGAYSSNIFCDVQGSGTPNDLVFRTGASGAQKLTYLNGDGRLTLAAQATGTYDALPLGQGETLFNPGRLLNVQVFSSSGTYTPSSGTNKIKVRIWGGGGGGGGSVASSSTGGSGGTGGTGGAYAEGIFSVSGSLQATVGAGGAGGQGDNYGSGGGASSLGTLITAGGGAYGLSAIAGSAAPGATSVPSASGGYFLFSPGASADAFPLGGSNNGFFGSSGTASFGSTQSNMSVTNGFFGVFPGGGGGGAGSYAASGNTANGGTGANGLIIIEEYS